jgi:TorA maturation chaperone TorD
LRFPAVGTDAPGILEGTISAGIGFTRHIAGDPSAWNHTEGTAMTNEELFVAGALSAWRSNLERADKLFSRLTEEELLTEVAPGRNRLIYLWGHLTATHDRMLTILGLGPRLAPEFDALFLSTADKVSDLPPVAEVRRTWDEVNSRLREGFATLSAADWLRKHGSVSDEDYAKDPLRNRFAILLSRTSHLAYHLGQAVLVPVPVK